LTNVPSQVELNQLLQNKIEVNSNAKTRNIDGVNGAKTSRAKSSYKHQRNSSMALKQGKD